MSLKKNALISTIAVMGSRVMGLVREVAFAYFFGASATLDAFIAAFRIPNLLRDLFAEGALSNAFVTVFSKKMAKEGDKSAWELATRIFIFVLLVIGALTVLGIVFSPALVHFVASGFDGDKFALTVSLNRILFPFILFVSLAAIAMGMLNAKGSFALPQSASTFFNITSILFGLGFAYLLAPTVILFPLTHQGSSPGWEESARAMMGMAYGTLFGGLVQWLIQMPSLLRKGFKFQKQGKIFDESLLEVLKLTGPAIIGGAAVQINVLINTNFASYLESGSISWLQYAFRLMQFPIGVFGVAIATACTPALARAKALENLNELKTTLRESTRLVLFLCLPSALGLILLANPILAMIYEYGRFTAFDTLQASYALQAYAVGLVSYALIKVYQPAFLVFNDAKTPMALSLTSIVINILFNGFFVFVLNVGHWGLALGTSIVALWNGIMLNILFRKKMKGIWNRELLLQSLKILFASILACGIGYGSYFFLPIDNSTIFIRLTHVFIPIGITGVVY